MGVLKVNLMHVIRQGPFRVEPLMQSHLQVSFSFRRPQILNRMKKKSKFVGKKTKKQKKNILHFWSVCYMNIFFSYCTMKKRANGQTL
jgi:hypothetical protein